MNWVLCWRVCDLNGNRTTTATTLSVPVGNWLTGKRRRLYSHFSRFCWIALISREKKEKSVQLIKWPVIPLQWFLLETPTLSLFFLFGHFVSIFFLSFFLWFEQGGDAAWVENFIFVFVFSSSSSSSFSSASFGRLMKLLELAEVLLQFNAVSYFVSLFDFCFR